MENGEQNLGRILSSNCVQSVAHLQNCHKPHPAFSLIQIAVFLPSQSHGQVKESKYGGMNFSIDHLLPGYLCSSGRWEQISRASRGQIRP